MKHEFYGITGQLKLLERLIHCHNLGFKFKATSDEPIKTYVVQLYCNLRPQSGICDFCVDLGK